MFAPFDSAHRTEQSDIGLETSGRLYKIRPEEPRYRKVLENSEKFQNRFFQLEYSQKPPNYDFCLLELHSVKIDFYLLVFGGYAFRLKVVSV